MNIGVHFMCSMPAMSENMNVQKGIQLLNLNVPKQHPFSGTQ